MRLQHLDKPQSYRDAVYQTIKEAIIAQELTPGTPLQERQLAEELGVSRTPVREALSRLELDGWVLSQPWKGSVVAPIRPRDITEVFQLRRANEALVVELVTHRLKTAQLLDLQRLLEEQEAAGRSGDRVRFINIDRQWHERLAECTDNLRLIQLLHNISDHVKRLGIQAVTKPTRIQATLDEHWAVQRALAARDVTAAVSAMVTHVVNTQNIILETLAETSSEEAPGSNAGRQ